MIIVKAYKGVQMNYKWDHHNVIG